MPAFFFFLASFLARSFSALACFFRMRSPATPPRLLNDSCFTGSGLFAFFAFFASLGGGWPSMPYALDSAPSSAGVMPAHTPCSALNASRTLNM